VVPDREAKDGRWVATKVLASKESRSKGPESSMALGPSSKREVDSRLRPHYGPRLVLLCHVVRSQCHACTDSAVVV